MVNDKLLHDCYENNLIHLGQLFVNNEEMIRKNDYDWEFQIYMLYVYCLRIGETQFQTWKRWRSRGFLKQLSHKNLMLTLVSMYAYPLFELEFNEQDWPYVYQYVKEIVGFNVGIALTHSQILRFLLRHNHTTVIISLVNIAMWNERYGEIKIMYPYCPPLVQDIIRLYFRVPKDTGYTQGVHQQLGQAVRDIFDFDDMLRNDQ